MASQEEQGKAPRAAQGPARRLPSYALKVPPRHVTMGLKAVAAGTANADQQRQVMKWIIEEWCGTYNWAFHPGGPDGQRETDLALGRQSVGQAIVLELNLTGSALNSERSEHG